MDIDIDGRGGARSIITQKSVVKVTRMLLYRGVEERGRAARDVEAIQIQGEDDDEHREVRRGEGVAPHRWSTTQTRY
jgi:hypothetical protein